MSNRSSFDLPWRSPSDAEFSPHKNESKRSISGPQSQSLRQQLKRVAENTGQLDGSRLSKAMPKAADHTMRQRTKSEMKLDADRDERPKQTSSSLTVSKSAVQRLSQMVNPDVKHSRASPSNSFQGEPRPSMSPVESTVRTTFTQQRRVSAQSQGNAFRGSQFRTAIAEDEGATHGPCRSLSEHCSEVRRRLAPYCRWLIRTRIFQVVMLFSLISALFLPDFWVLLDKPNNYDLDIILTIVLSLFVAEFLTQSIGHPTTYYGSFFFWMDLVGAVSLLMDLSYFPLLQMVSGSEDLSGNTVIMRAARVAKLGARAGRFTKLVKLLRFLPGMREMNADQATAKVISSKLLTALSTRVSCLIILMVVLMPLFSFWSYPEQDWSMMSWMDILERAGTKHPQRFPEQLEEFARFYAEMPYFPWLIKYKFPTLQGSFLPPRGRPRRAWNTMRIQTVHLDCEFNFTTPNQLDAGMNIALIFLVMLLMLAFSLVLSKSVSGIVLRPLEKLLQRVKQAADTILGTVSNMADTMQEETSEQVDTEEGEQGEETSAGGFQAETHLLERVVEKLAVLGQLVTQKSHLDEERLAELGEDDRAMFGAYHETGGGYAGHEQPGTEDEAAEPIAESGAAFEAQRTMIINAGLSLDLLDSWNLNPLELDKPRCHAACMFFLGPHNHGVGFDPMIMGNFLMAVESGYLSVPYHNWFHGVDVTHTVYRLLRLCCSELYFTNNERFALIVSATSHDLGHPGQNNPFLVETSHEFALLYNDKSPLENLHCSKLFEIISMPRSNIFSGLSKKEFQDVRKVCIEAILHTDFAQHFRMIKEVQVLYEMHSGVLGTARGEHAQDPSRFPSRDIVDCFKTADTRQLLQRLILHVADISNPTKPFRVCRVWAWKILDEMFAQGDNEKSLGVPVQALNDRDKVNRPFSQVGFIEFLVAPLAFIVGKVLPPFSPCVEHMVRNVKSWQEVWSMETLPAPKDDEKKSMDERVAKLASKLFDSM